GQGIAGHVAQTGAPLLINGPASGMRFPGLVSKHVSVASALSVPLVERGRLVGVLNVSADGDRRFTEYDLRAVNLFAEHAAAAIAKASLYEETRRQATELAHAATHDPLTGLANRIALAASMRMLPPLTPRDLAVSRGHDENKDHIERRFGSALLFIDLDGFKQVNDTYGHHVGDALLVAVAGRIAHNLAGQDVAARLGGDEFAVLAHGVSGPQVALTIAQRVLAGLTPPVTVDGVTISITASIGIALAPADDRDLDAMLRQADRALYAAKAAGKSCCCLADPERPDRWIVVNLTGSGVSMPVQRLADEAVSLLAVDGER
ncbi:MAG: GAF domain-containing protein, partial [Mycobacteriales bacterium]